MFRVSSTNSSWNSSNFPKSLSPPLISLLIVVADNYELQFVKQGVFQDHGRSYHKCHFDKNYVVLRMSWKQLKVYICCRAFGQAYMR